MVTHTAMLTFQPLGHQRTTILGQWSASSK